jgi:hypothetical protein
MKDKHASTYAAFAQAEADQPRGRFSAIDKNEVIGSAPVPQYPPLPQNSPWSNDPVPSEEPLGYSVHEHPVVGEAFEILDVQRDGTDQSSAVEPPSGEVSGSGAGSPSGAVETASPLSRSKRKRR